MEELLEEPVHVVYNRTGLIQNLFAWFPVGLLQNVMHIYNRQLLYYLVHTIISYSTGVYIYITSFVVYLL